MIADCAFWGSRFGGIALGGDRGLNVYAAIRIRIPKSEVVWAGTKTAKAVSKWLEDSKHLDLMGRRVVDSAGFQLDFQHIASGF
jgi:hypothetical protein